DLRLLGPLRGEDRGAAVALGAHLLLHRVLARVRRADGLQLDPGDTQPPLAGRLAAHDARLAVALVAAGPRPLAPRPAAVASSSTMRSLLLISSRLVSASSRLSPPTTLRRVVVVSCSTALR